MNDKLRIIASIYDKELSSDLERALDIPSEEKRQPDLQYINAVYVSSGYNLNSAYFLPSELIRARDTITDKPLDIEHDQDKIVGHLSSVAFSYLDGTLFNPEELMVVLGNRVDSVQMNIVTAMRLYKARFPELAEEVTSGKYKVSMECYYRDFDVIVDNIIIPRDEANKLGLTNMINSTISVVEGSSSKGSYRVGRVLRGMLFSGCGLVENPANPASVILETAANGSNYILDLCKVDSYMKSKQENEKLVLNVIEGAEKDKAYLSAAYGGRHEHDISLDSDFTFMDGLHSHIIKANDVPEGQYLYFEYDGGHRHSFNNKDGSVGNEKEHVHKLYLESMDDSYTALETSAPIKPHSHEFLRADVVENYDKKTNRYSTSVGTGVGVTSAGGIHYHTVSLPDGTKLKTLVPADLLNMEESMKKEDKNKEEAAISNADGHPLSTPDICVSFKRYVYDKGGDNPGVPANADKTPGLIPQVESLPAPTGGGAGDTITQMDTIVHENWCSLFEEGCPVLGGQATHPDCLRLVLERTTKEAVSNYYQKLVDNRNKLGVGAALSSLQDALNKVGSKE